jgi:hypothetical protein
MQAKSGTRASWTGRRGQQPEDTGNNQRHEKSTEDSETPSKSRKIQGEQDARCFGMNFSVQPQSRQQRPVRECVCVCVGFDIHPHYLHLCRHYFSSPCVSAILSVPTRIRAVCLPVDNLLFHLNSSHNVEETLVVYSRVITSHSRFLMFSSLEITRFVRW